MMMPVRDRVHDHRLPVRGFTLIEVLVAMAITAIVGVMAYATLNSAVDAVQRSELQTQRLNDINTFFGIFSKDIRQVVARSIRNEAGEQESALLSQDGDLVGLRLTRTGWQNPRPEVFVRSQLQRVHYQLENKTLVRESFYMIDRPEGEPEPVRSELLDKVVSLKFRFLPEPSRGGTHELLKGEWTDSWPPKTQNELDQKVASTLLPAVVEIKLELQDWGEVRRVYDLVLNDPAGTPAPTAAGGTN
jgi:general secretion pathway protein J